MATQDKPDDLPHSEPIEMALRDELPLLPVRDLVVFPYMILPLFVGRERSVAAVEKALENDRLIVLTAQIDPEVDEPTAADLYPVGTLAMVMRMVKLSDGRLKILVQGLAKVAIQRFTVETPCMEVRAEKLIEPTVETIDVETEALMRTVREQLPELLKLGKNISPEVVAVIGNMEDPGSLADLVASNIGLPVDKAQALFAVIDPLKRLQQVEQVLVKELELMAVQHRIQNQAKEEMSKSQRDYFLREQLRAIRNELGESDAHAEDMEELREKLQALKLPEAIAEEAERQLKRLESMHPDAGEYSILRTYMDWLVELPWSKSSRDKLDLKQARAVLEEDHYGLDKIKERILEYLAVRKLKKKMRGPVLCFVGPPGVGKTSLGKSIARALGRQFVRISLGGMRDEAEIRGHRRTYIGALPGRIIQGIRQAGTNNPVFMLDELDKVGSDFRGDPSAALLELLDPEQNHAFSDHYINLPYDLSNVMFIATANVTDTIPPALKDRMEVIRLAGYTTEEKLTIAQRYLVPRQIDASGLSKKDLRFSKPSLLRLIREYTAEAGLRNLEREIGSICRKVALRLAEGKQPPSMISDAQVSRLLGPPRFSDEEQRQTDEVGVATGLAWTQVGGEVLNVEVTLMEGKGEIILTGQLGDVMRESAKAAQSYARAHAEALQIDLQRFRKTDMHLHIPAGAIPKDGPSAGVTMATAMISAFCHRPVRKDVAMTGEITLRGRVLPVGGVKEKVLAALRYNITTLILPQRNLKDLEEIPRHLRSKIEVIPAETIEQVLEAALLPSGGDGA